MFDSRIKKLAEILVNYCIEVKPGDWVMVQGNIITEPLVREIAASVLRAGGHPTSWFGSDGLQDALYYEANREQLEWVSPLETLLVNQIDAQIGIMGTENTRSMSQVNPQKQQWLAASRRELSEIFMQRAANKELRWTGTLYPCAAYAQEAEMSLREYEDFVFGATFVDKEDPVAEWLRIHNEQQRIIDWLEGKKIISVKSPSADLTLSIEGRTFINADGKQNMPSGEIFTSPVEDSANGWVNFTYPAITGGREVEGVRLEFQDGKVVKASAKKNEEFLLSRLDTDPGARYLGEWAIGTNYGITQFTKNILFDEKIGGTFHLAVGRGFPEAGSKNKSAIHWDLICDLREDSEVRADGELFYKNGQFQI
jgi:aminopeptidase